MYPAGSEDDCVNRGAANIGSMSAFEVRGLSVTEAVDPRGGRSNKAGDRCAILESNAGETADEEVQESST